MYYVQFFFFRIQSDVQKEREISKVAQEFSETVTDPKIQATEVCVIVSGAIWVNRMVWECVFRIVNNASLGFSLSDFSFSL